MLFIVSLGLTALRGLEVLLHEGMLQELGDVRAVLRILLQNGGDELFEPRAVGVRNGLELDSSVGSIILQNWKQDKMNQNIGVPN